MMKDSPAPSGVVVTGLAVSCGLGDTTDVVWRAVREGACGVAPIERLDVATLTCQVASELVSSPSGADRAIGLAVQVASAAVGDASLDLTALDPYRVGVSLGTSVGGLERGESWQRDLLKGGPDATRTGLLLTYPLYTSADAVSVALGLKGPKVVISNACAAGANAIGWAADQIRTGRADVMVAGGVDVLDILSLAGFDSLKALDPERCAPLTRSTGLNLGEGAGFVVLESEDHARDRGAAPVAWFRGYGLSSDAHHATAPDPRGTGALRSMRRALDVGGATPGAVGYVNAHGTGTPANDTSEPLALKALFGEQLPPVSSTKSQVGHTLGAAGAVEAVATVLALRDSVLPPTVNTGTSERRTLPDIVEGVAREQQVELAVSNSFAFGGNNCSLLFGAGPGEQSARPRRRVVVTGAGALTGIGTGRSAFLDALAAGRRAATQESELDLSLSRRPVVAALGRDHLRLVDRSYLRRLDQLGTMVLATCRMALDDARVNVGKVGAERVGMTFGTFTGPLETVSALSTVITQKGPEHVSPRLFPNSVVNAAVGHACLSFQVKGPLSTLATGCVAGLEAVQYAADLVADGEADVMLAMASDEITPELHLGYDRLGVLGDVDSIPYSASATGLVPGAGAAAVVLEEREHALARGATILGEVLGQCTTADAHRVAGNEPSGEAWATSLGLALERSGVTADAVAAVYGDARGTALIDAAELRAVAAAVGPGARVANVAAQTGHLGATTPVLSVVAALQSAATGWVPPVCGLEEPIAELDGMSTAGRAAGQERVSLVTAVNWGGTYTSLVVGPA